MHLNKTKFERNGSLECHDLYWENKAYKLKRSIDILRYEENDGGENVDLKLNSPSFNDHRDYSNSLTL